MGRGYFLAVWEYSTVNTIQQNTGINREILMVLLRPFSVAALDFRHFHKIHLKNNRELLYQKQGFHPPISGNIPTPPVPRYTAPFIANPDP